MLQQPLDLAILALVQNHREPAIGALTAIDRCGNRSIPDAVDRQTPPQPRNYRTIDMAVCAHAIGSCERSRRMLKVAREFTVVSQQQESLGIDIEPTDRDYARQTFAQRV